MMYKIMFQIIFFQNRKKPAAFIPESKKINNRARLIENFACVLLLQLTNLLKNSTYKDSIHKVIRQIYDKNFDNMFYGNPPCLHRLTFVIDRLCLSSIISIRVLAILSLHFKGAFSSRNKSSHLLIY